MALGLQSEVDHHDGVLLDNADQQHDADGRNQGQVLPKVHQGPQCAHGRRWQARQNRDGVDIAFVQHPEQHINHHQCGEDQNQLTALRIFEYGRVAPVRGDHRRRHLNRFARLVNLGGRISQGRARRQVERDGHRL